MTPEETIEQQIEQLKKDIIENSDPEATHGIEDNIMVQIITLAANGHNVESIALKLIPIPESHHTRWYA